LSAKTNPAATTTINRDNATRTILFMWTSSY
jgi:hypothetical protein